VYCLLVCYPGLAAAIKEYDELKRKLEGSKVTEFKGKDSFGRYTVASEEGWTQDKTAEDLDISRQAVSKAIQIAGAIEEFPELTLAGKQSSPYRRGCKRAMLR
jgi:hypothetical protein